MRTPAALLLSAGCTLGQPDSHWSDQLEPDGPCWRVDLSDGLDEASTDELHDLFSCLNRTGNLAPLAGIDEVMDESTRTDTPIGLTVAEMINLLPNSGYDVFGVAGKLLQALDQEHVDAAVVMEMFVEALYGRPYATVATSIDLQDPDELDRGLVRPALPVLAVTAETILDSGETLPDLFVSILESDRMDEATCTLAGVFASDDPTIRSIGAALLPNLGQALEEMTNTDNDLWLGASGNSGHDFIEFMLLESGPDGQTGLEGISAELLQLMTDEEIQSRTRVALAVARDRGNLHLFPQQLNYLSSIDVWGNPLLRGSGNPSALEVGLRMLHKGNTDVVCSIPIALTSIDINLGNLSQEIIRVLAESSLTDIEDVVDILGNVLDADITREIIDEVIDRQLCDPIDRQFMEDLTILERMNDPELAALVPILVDMLDVVYSPGEIDRIPDLVDLLSVFYERDLIAPFSELLHDWSQTRLMDDAMTMTGILLNPDSLQVDECPDGSEPLDFNEIWQIALGALTSEDGQPTTIETITPVIENTASLPETWTVINNLASLLQEDGAQLQALPELFLDSLDLIESTEPTNAIAQLIDDPALRNRLLHILESRELRDAVMAAEEGEDGPLSFVAKLVTSEAVTVMLQTIDLLFDSLRESDDDSNVND